MPYGPASEATPHAKSSRGQSLAIVTYNQSPELYDAYHNTGIPTQR
jgi:hypothetical protein